MSGRAPILAFALMLASGLALGAWSSYRVLASGAGPGSLRYGPWVTWHKAGALDADPYSLAAFARRGDIPMAPGEGVAFFASRDAGGAPLWGGCSYEIGGLFPQARAWTLTVYAAHGDLLAGPSGRSSFTSGEALVSGGRTVIMISPQPQPGNWIPITTRERMIVALRLYETPLSAVADALDADRLPGLRRMGCQP